MKVEIKRSSKHPIWWFWEKLKVRFWNLPIVLCISSWIETIKLEWQMRNMDSYERYLFIKRRENFMKNLVLITTMLKLLAYFVGDDTDDETFQEIKKELLSNEKINEPQYKQFKEWLESINADDKNIEKLKAFVEELDPNG